MKKIITMLIVFFINLTPCMYAENFDEVEVKNEGSRVVVKLPYNKEKGRDKYFAEEVKTALIVDDVLVDGISVTRDYDSAAYFSLADEYKTIRISSSEQYVYIKMYWRMNKNKYWVFPYRGDLFVVEPGTEVTVLYRVIYPFPFGNSERLLQRKFKEKYISPIYSAKLVLPSMEVDQ